MERRYILLNPFILGVLVAGILGNISLGLITAGLTVLVWGFETGMNFIAITTILLVSLTGNINLEIIFLYVLSLAFLIKQRTFLKKIDQRLLYTIVGVISVISYQGWGLLLGLIPAQCLNEINIAGEILLIAGLLLSLMRGKKVIYKGERGDIIYFFFILIIAILALKGNLVVIPFWISGIFVVYFYLEKQMLNKQVDLKKTSLLSPGLSLGLFLVVITIYAGYILLPESKIISAGVMIIYFSLYWWQKRVQRIPLMEIIYLSFILGILAGRLGLLS